MKTTITEAMAELKTIKKRLDKKMQTIVPNSIRASIVIDPMANEEGGSSGWIARERQSYADLISRYRRIRVAIQKANQENQVTIGNRTMSVADWLTWRKECAQPEESLLATLLNNVKGNRIEIEKRSTVDNKMTLVVNFDEAQASKDLESIITMKGELDGRLSLFNSTVYIDVE